MTLPTPVSQIIGPGAVATAITKLIILGLETQETQPSAIK